MRPWVTYCLLLATLCVSLAITLFVLLSRSAGELHPSAVDATWHLLLG